MHQCLLGTGAFTFYFINTLQCETFWNKHPYNQPDVKKKKIITVPPRPVSHGSSFPPSKFCQLVTLAGLLSLTKPRFSHSNYSGDENACCLLSELSPRLSCTVLPRAGHTTLHAVTRACRVESSKRVRCLYAVCTSRPPTLPSTKCWSRSNSRTRQSTASIFSQYQ